MQGALTEDTSIHKTGSLWPYSERKNCRGWMDGGREGRGGRERGRDRDREGEREGGEWEGGGRGGGGGGGGGREGRVNTQIHSPHD